MSTEAGKVKIEVKNVHKGFATEKGRLQVMAAHSEENLRDAVAALKAAFAAGCEEFDWLDSEREKLRVNG